MIPCLMIFQVALQTLRVSNTLPMQMILTLHACGGNETFLLGLPPGPFRVEVSINKGKSNFRLHAVLSTDLGNPSVRRQPNVWAKSPETKEPKECVIALPFSDFVPEGKREFDRLGMGAEVNFKVYVGRAG